ncbi:HlyD family efflux transporter periplasmic adaptor subunit [Patescibacteria group bacterium]|nr:HlyD family efflux transporter periplasmic adaptor subunit [Patescibacteria group bacterium]
MKFPGFLKKKRTYVIAVLALGVGWYVMAGRGGNGAAQFETAPVEKRDLVQTVEVTGEIKPAARIEMGFKNGGTIDSIMVKVGANVKKGDVLAQLEADDVEYTARAAAASLAIAQANLDARIAGETKQSIRVSEAQVEQSEANLDKAIADLASTKQTTQDSLKTAEVALQTARDNVENQGAILSQNISNAVASARVTLLTAVGPLNSGLSDGDTISGVDNTAANQSFVNLLGFLDQGSLERSKASYGVAKSAKIEAETALNALTNASTKEQVESAAAKLQTAITLVQVYLTDVQRVLAATLTSSNFTEASLAAKKSLIDADRASVSAQNTSVLTALQTIQNTGLTQTQTVDSLQNAYVTAQTAYETAKTNADVQVRAAETNVAIQRAMLDSSKASLELKVAGPRAVDLAPLRASVEQAAVQYEKAMNDLMNVQIIAPVDGTISEVLPDVGEQISPNAIAVKLIGTEMYDIEAQVPEADISKILEGQTAVITLDAYGDDVKFKGTVTAKDPAETRVQDAIYYKIRVQIEPGEKEVKPAMTANVTVTTGESKNVLVIPLRGIRTKAETGQKTVRILVNDTPEERNVELGLRGDEGRVEIKSGLTEGENVIVGETATTP